MMTRGIKLISAFFHPSSRHAWGEELQMTARSLGELTSSTEGEFLSLGAKLQQFNGCSREISQLSSSITALMSGDEMTDAMEGLRQILQKIRDLEKGSRQGIEILKEILERIEAMHRPLNGFERVIRNLRVLCSFIKIESARLECSDTGFNTLSEDVTNLAEKIASKSADLCDQSTLLSELVKGNLDKIGQFERSRHGQAQFIIDSTLHCLNSLTEKHDHSLATVKDVAARWDQITRNIGEVVSSLQFHDITRQRIEHVKESLLEVTDTRSGTQSPEEANGSPAGHVVSPGKGASRRSGGLTTAINACTLQRAQLDHARIEVVSAIERIITGLQSIGRNVEEMCEETRSLLKGTESDATGSSFISSLENSFTALTGSTAEYDRINEELSMTIDHAAQTIEAMSAFISDIEKIGIEIRMIGLNACIRAAQVGEKGASLGVLADSIHQLSADTTGHTNLISESLKMVIQSAHALAESVSREAAGEKNGQHHLEQDVVRMMTPLRQVDEETLLLLNRINESGQALSGEITSTSTGIQVHRQFDRGIEQVVDRLDTFIKNMKSFRPAAEAGKSREDLEELKGRYTMHSERQVHRAVTGEAIGAISPGVAAPVVALVEGANESARTGAEDLGDNVELF